MKELIITSGQTILLDQEDYDRVTAYRWIAKQFKRGPRIIRTVRKKGDSALPYFIMGTSWAEVGIIEYLDGDVLNNQKCNLLIVTDQMRKQRKKDRHATYLSDMNDQQLTAYKTRRSSDAIKCYHNNTNIYRRKLIARWIARGKPSLHKENVSIQQWIRMRSMAKITAARHREELADYYVKSRIMLVTPGLQREDITPQMVEIQRKILKLKRHVKEQKGKLR